MDMLSSEELEFLKEFAHKRKTQPNDGCAQPVFWMIEDQKNVYCEDGEYAEIYSDGEIFYSTYHTNTEDDLKEFKDYVLDRCVLNEDEKEELSAIEDDDELVEWIESCYSIDEFTIARFTREYFLSYLSGPFLTKEAAQRHLEENSHHYSKNARTYGMVGWRNPEFEALMKILEKFDGGQDNG